MHQYTLESTQLENSLAKKALGMLVDTTVHMNQQCALAARKADK